MLKSVSGAFPPDQKYAVIVLQNGGTDLEAYNLKQSYGWSQACSIFWQVAAALQRAEDLAQFEVRQHILQTG